jgi:hypothetical protein
MKSQWSCISTYLSSNATSDKPLVNSATARSTLSRFGVSPVTALHLLATTHLSELRLSRLALFTVTHLHKLSIASAMQPQFNPLILPAHTPSQTQYIQNMHADTTNIWALKPEQCTNPIAAPPSVTPKTASHSTTHHVTSIAKLRHARHVTSISSYVICGEIVCKICRPLYKHEIRLRD